jgi:hypothetical protein
MMGCFPEHAQSPSKITVERLAHLLKHLSPVVVTEDGIAIDVSAEHSRNASSAIWIKSTPLSKITAERLLQLAKQP